MAKEKEIQEEEVLDTPAEVETPAEEVEVAPKKESKAKASDDIVVHDALDLRPTELPLVIELPKSASKAQVAFAKVLNAYAYEAPVNWAREKDDYEHTDEFGQKTVVKGLLTKLRELKNAPDPIEATNLKFGNKLGSE